MKKFIVTVALLFPLTALALDYTNSTGKYKDAPFSTKEEAGISVLTNLGAVQGNPDGKFVPGRTLNRAEFLKIVWLTVPNARGPWWDTMSLNCFPDVKPSDWFAQYVCGGKTANWLNGYPDRYFHPERNVNYAEALKILVNAYRLRESFGQSLPDNPWYAAYIEIADTEGVALENVWPGLEITRGQMARLAAKFRALAEGELDLYEKAEMGMSSSSSSKSSSSSSSISSSSSSSSSSVMSSSSSSKAANLPDFPARSRFLILGQRSQPIAGATFFANLEPVRVRGAEVKLRKKVESIDAMFVVSEDGVELGQLSLDKFDDTDKTWRGTFQSGSGYLIPKNEQRILGVEVRLKPRDGGGSSEQLVWVDSIKISVTGEWTGSTFDSPPTQEIIYPQSQTAQGRITSVKNAIAADDLFFSGTNQVVAAFSFSGSVVSGADLRLRHLEFQISKSAGIAVSNWQLGSADSPDRVLCSVNSDVLNCNDVPASLGTLTSGPRTLQLYADTALDQGAKDYFLQVSLNQPGVIGQNGAVRWTDGSGEFTWTELTAPIAKGTRWH